MLEILLTHSKHEININQQHKDGYTALHCAVIYGEIEMAKCLLDHGAKIDIPNTTYGYKVLHYVCMNQMQDMLEILLTHSKH